MANHAVDESLAGIHGTRTTSQSDNTRVPPVTGGEKSPPDSRTTGADSPVMALSSTEANALDHQLRRPESRRGFHQKKSPLRSCGAGVAAQSERDFTDRNFLALTDCFKPRSESRFGTAPAFGQRPRPKFAKRTVNQSQAALTAKMKPPRLALTA